MQTFLEQCCTVLDVYDMLRSDVTRLCHMFVGSKYITDNDVAALDWAALRGPELAGVATQADVRLLLQLLICSQAIPPSLFPLSFSPATILLAHSGHELRKRSQLP